MDLGLTGHKAIVTGGSRGIGRATALQLAREGVDVAIVARTEATNVEAARQISEETGRKILALQGDTNDTRAVEAMVRQAKSEFGHIDILVNAAAQPAGQSRPPSLMEVDEAALWAEINTKVLGYLRFIQNVVPLMKERGYGRIINISGLAARQTGSIVGSVRNISVAAMTKNIAEELQKTGITTICVHPGLTWTEKSPQVVKARAQARGVSEEQILQEFDLANLNGKVITAAQIADLVAFLASPRSVAINGDVIAAGGGARGSIHY